MADPSIFFHHFSSPIVYNKSPIENRIRLRYITLRRFIVYTIYTARALSNEHQRWVYIKKMYLFPDLWSSFLNGVTKTKVYTTYCVMRREQLPNYFKGLPLEWTHFCLKRRGCQKLQGILTAIVNRYQIFGDGEGGKCINRHIIITALVPYAPALKKAFITHCMTFRENHFCWDECRLQSLTKPEMLHKKCS